MSANLSQRWCSAYTKIDVMAALIRAQTRFLDRRTLIVTGERSQESSARAGYAVFEPDRTDTRDGTRRRRHADHWRPVHALDERAVWSLMRRHGIVLAPAYRLGWSRLSCLGCIFGKPDRWASLRVIAPAWFERIAGYEAQFARTIQRHCSIRALADRGRPYLAALTQPDLARRALATTGPSPFAADHAIGDCQPAPSATAAAQPERRRMMVDLVLRPSTLVPDKKWALQLRWHECCGPTEYHTIAHVSDEIAREIVRAGAPTWLFGDPNKEADQATEHGSAEGP